MSAGSDRRSAQGLSWLRNLFASLRQRSTDSPDLAPAGGAHPLPTEPVRLLSAPDTARAPQQTSILDPFANPRFSGRVVALQDFVNRFRRLMAKQGVKSTDPLGPILDMLCETLVHLTHLAEDLETVLIEHTRISTVKSQTFMHQSQGLNAEQARILERTLEQKTQRIEAAIVLLGKERQGLLGTFGSDTEKLLRTTVIRVAQTRFWTRWTMTLAVVAGVVILARSDAYRLGVEQTRSEMQAAKTLIETVLLSKGPDVAMKWARLAEWNDLSRVKPSCAPQPYGNVYRQACSYALWSAAPIDSPPAP